MDKEFIPYELALALKELGFNENCFGYYSGTKRLNVFHNTPMSDRNNSFMPKLFVSTTVITAPLYQQAFRYFADKYNMYRSIDALFNGGGFRAVIVNTKEQHIVVLDDRFDTYEEAELACLKKLIKIVKAL